MERENTRHRLDIGDILREHGEAFLAHHKLCSDQLKAYQAIYNCRTAEMGGHIDHCDHCGYQRVAYNSCRNRNCNKCQYTKQLQWIDKLQSNLLVCPYFHVVFTIPESLHSLFYINQRVCYNLLFQAAWQSLQKLARNPQFLFVQPGAVAVLHTWGDAVSRQILKYHPHIHISSTAG